MPTLTSAYCDQPKVTPASTETTGTFGGKTVARYCAGCCSNRSMLGIETTLTFVPDSDNNFAAATHTETSLPVPTKMRSGLGDALIVSAPNLTASPSVVIGND